MRAWIMAAMLCGTLALQTSGVWAAPHDKLLPPLPELPPVEGEYAPGVQGEVPMVTPAQAPEKEQKEWHNQVEWVMAVDYMTVELRMKKPLPEAELQPDAVALARRNFLFSEGVTALSAPMPVAGEDNLYRLRVDGLAPDQMYMVRYGNSPELTFRTYPTQEEMDRNYKNRYGDHW